jgi:hypothetical protein
VERSGLEIGTISWLYALKAREIRHVEAALEGLLRGILPAPPYGEQNQEESGEDESRRQPQMEGQEGE